MKRSSSSVYDELSSLNNSLLAMKTQQNSRSDVGQLYRYTLTQTYSASLTKGTHTYSGVPMVRIDFESNTGITPVCVWSGSMTDLTDGDDSGDPNASYLQPPGAGGGESLIMYLNVYSNNSSINIRVFAEVIATQPGRLKFSIL